MTSSGLVIFALIVTLGFAGAVAAAAAALEPAARPRRSLLRALDDGSDDLPDVAVELNSSDFDAALRQSPARFAVVEFFAHWCPACRNYKPHYEKVARLFNGPNAVHPGIVAMTRVDCAHKINSKLCDRFSVSHYPMLFWGHPRKFTSGAWSPKQEQSDILPIDDGRTAERLLNWINKRLNSTFSLEDEKFENENTLPHNASDPEQVARAIYDIEEATAGAFDIILEHKMIKPDTQAPFIKFLQLISAHHPSKRCRRGSAEILVNFDDVWPLDSLSTSAKDMDSPHDMSMLKNFQICGKEVPRGYWDIRTSGAPVLYLTSWAYLLMCKAEDEKHEWLAADILSWKQERYQGVQNAALCSDTDLMTHTIIFTVSNFQGPVLLKGHDFFLEIGLVRTMAVTFSLLQSYISWVHSCGLWVLFHSLSVRVRDEESHLAFSTICDFIHNFFVCEECRQHFYKMCSSVTTPFNTTRDLCLWLWSTHNRVNGRLMKTEKALGTGDPKFPKMIWPPKQLCLSCYRSPGRISNGTLQVDWNKDEVFSFLVRYYGKTLVSSYKDENRSSGGNSVSVGDEVATSTNAVAVPVGAALGIALASCAFGALACFWRAQQKNRKQRKRTDPHP